MIQRTDILEELIHERDKVLQELTLKNAENLLEEEAAANQRIYAGLRGRKGPHVFPSLKSLDPERVFSITEIKNICIQYRMRFLSSRYFKGEIPAEAFSKIREIERRHEVELHHFLILAPKQLFQLSDADADPMLFIPLANGKYYLVHKWGLDMQWHRRIISYPMQSVGNMITSLVIAAAVIALITPNAIIVPDSNYVFNNVFSYWGFHRITFFFHLVILFCASAVFILFAFHQNLSDSEWNRKTFN